jgi:hypothetical protein
LISAITIDAAGAYEKLRAAVLCAEPVGCQGLGVIHRQGLAAWIRSIAQQPSLSDAIRCDHPPGCSPAQDQSQGTNELTHRIADIIVSIGMECSHA